MAVLLLQMLVFSRLSEVALVVKDRVFDLYLGFSFMDTDVTEALGRLVSSLLRAGVGLNFLEIIDMCFECAETGSLETLRASHISVYRGHQASDIRAFDQVRALLRYSLGTASASVLQCTRGWSSLAAKD